MKQLLAIPAALLLLASPALAKDELPEITVDGLVRVSGSEWAVVYAEPDADLSGYNKVVVLETAVAFKKNWQRDFNRDSRANRVTDQDMERIRNKLSKEFGEVFRQVLEADDGYPVVDEKGADVLLLRPAIVDLDVTAPADLGVGRSQIYADNAGAMSLYLEIYDSLTGDLIAKGYDRKADRRAAFMNWQTSVSNRQAADRILKAWAQSLRDALDEAHAKARP